MLAQMSNPGHERDEALLSWIQQLAPYGVITLDESFQVQTWNHWMEVNSGKQFQDVAGKSLFDLFPDLHERKLVAHFERALQGEASVLSTGLHRYLLPLPSPFRESGPVQMLQTARIAPLFSAGQICGVVVVLEDVTQRESQAEALTRQHRRDELLSWALAHLLKTEQPRKAVRQLFFKIAEHIDFDTFLIYLRDLETGQLTLDAVGGVPPEFEQAFLSCPFLSLLAGETNEVVVLNSVQARSGPQYAPLQKARISSAVAIPLFTDERNLGLLCFASWSRHSIAADEVELVKTIAQYLATALDRENTSGQLRKAKELLSEHAALLEHRVQERTARLQESVSELETFSSAIAHDLRAPVRTMSGYCDVLLEDFAEALPPDAKLVLKRIANASHRMDALTRDLLDFSWISRQDVALCRVEIEPLIENLSVIRDPAVRQAITIRAPLHPVRAHRSLLQQVLANLIDNGIKFVQPQSAPNITIFSELVPRLSPNTRSGPLTFSSNQPVSPPAPAENSPAERRINPAAAPPATPPQYVRVWVQDQGIGIPREAYQKIFGIFERGLGSQQYEGTGIGLAIVARAMQRMGGTCGVESEPGTGSRFWLELPAA
jgi:PAS domain S-box-containing protein